jgi:hypothetical protein
MCGRSSARSASCEWRRDRHTYLAKMLVSAEHKVDAPADVVYRYVADMREHHPHFLPPAFPTSGWNPVAWVLARSRDSR